MVRSTKAHGTLLFFVVTGGWDFFVFCRAGLCFQPRQACCKQALPKGFCKTLPVSNLSDIIHSIDSRMQSRKIHEKFRLSEYINQFQIDKFIFGAWQKTRSALLQKLFKQRYFSPCGRKKICTIFVSERSISTGVQLPSFFFAPAQILACELCGQGGLLPKRR
jgi:hypothetical protein